MFEFEINAKIFGGLAIWVEADRDGMRNAYFASSGNALPVKMYHRLENSWYDMETVNKNVMEETYA